MVFSSPFRTIARRSSDWLTRVVVGVAEGSIELEKSAPTLAAHLRPAAAIPPA